MINNEAQASHREERMFLLKQMLVLTEDMVGAMKRENCDIDAVNELLSKRQDIIVRLEDLDAAAPVDTPQLFSAEQLNDMNTMVRLILALSSDLEKMIETEKGRLLAHMKVNCKEQKLAMYQQQKKIPEGMASSGKRLDLNR